MKPLHFPQFNEVRMIRYHLNIETRHIIGYENQTDIPSVRNTKQNRVMLPKYTNK